MDTFRNRSRSKELGDLTNIDLRGFSSSFKCDRRRGRASFLYSQFRSEVALFNAAIHRECRRTAGRYQRARYLDVCLLASLAYHDLGVYSLDIERPHAVGPKFIDDLHRAIAHGGL